MSVSQSLYLYVFFYYPRGLSLYTKDSKVFPDFYDFRKDRSTEIEMISVENTFPVYIKKYDYLIWI